MPQLTRAARVPGVAHALMIGLSLAALLGGCGGGADYGTGPTAYGLVMAQLTGGTQLPDSVRSINVFVVRIDIRTAVADSASANTGVSDDSATVGGWTTIAAPDVLVNLAALLNGQMTTLGQGVLASGPYLGLRIIIDPSRSSVALTSGVVLTPSTSPTVSLPNRDRYGLPVQLLQPVVMTQGGQVTLAVDFDAIESFVARGSSVSLAGMNFTPVLRATVH